MKWSRLLQAALAILATAALLLADADEPSKAFWDTWRVLFYASVAILAYLAGSEILDRGIQDRRLARERRATESLKGALVDIQELTQLDWLDIGVHAFLVQRTWRHPIDGVLRRVARERLRVTTSSGVMWTKGKGAIGLCWEERRDVGVNLLEKWGPLLGCSLQDWEAASDDVKYGLSYEEFRRVGQYGAIVVTPMLDARDKVRGCVSVDAPGDAFELLWRPEVRETLQDTAQTIWRAITPLREE